jgi:large subunit ribosomal protein L23
VLQPYQVILRPIVTEKGFFYAEHANAYTFEVHKLASKEMIRAAVEELFDVKVLEVRVQNRKGKVRNVRTRNFQGEVKLRDWKKAIIKLHPESRINYF